jgi:inner membrane protein
MTHATHSAVGVALGLALALQAGRDPLTSLAATAVCAVAATLPDLDRKIGLKHRGVSHSLLMWSFITVLAWLFIPQVALSISTGFGSHLLLDSLTVTGIPLFFPVQKRIRLAHFTTGATMDGAIFVCAALVTIYLFGRL